MNLWATIALIVVVVLALLLLLFVAGIIDLTQAGSG